MFSNGANGEDAIGMQESKAALQTVAARAQAGADALENVLVHVGELGRYQRILFVCMLPFGFFFAFVYFVQMFVAATPQRHWCRVPELAHLDDMELRRNLTAPPKGDGWNRCQMYDANWTEVLLTMKPPDPSTPLVSCLHGWEFELGDIPYHTVVSERGWVCENSGYGPFAQAIFFVGAFFGGLLFGWMADHSGRVPALVGTNLVGCVGGIATVYTTGLWDFAFCRFLVGMAYDNCFMLFYILALEYVGPRYRTWVGNMAIGLFFGMGCVILPWLAVWIADWRKLIWVTSAPMLIVLFAPLVVPESTRWMSFRGQTNRAVKVLRTFEKVNGTKIPQEVMDEFIVSCRQTRQTDESLGALLKSAPLRNTMLLVLCAYMGCAILFDGLVRMSENLGLDFFVTFTVAAATEIPSITLLVLLLDRGGRRLLTAGPLMTAGLLSLIAAFVPKGAPQVSLATISRFCTNMSYNAAIQWATELLPTGVRASGSAVIHISGYIATIISPFIVYSEHLWSPLPLLIVGSVAVASGAVSLLVPETMGRAMPQTIADGEKLVMRHSMFSKRKEGVEELALKNDLQCVMTSKTGNQLSKDPQGYQKKSLVT